MRRTLVPDFKEYALPAGDDALRGFEHTIYRFPNNYGVSVVYGKGSYGLEALKIWFEDERNDAYHLFSTNKNYLTDEQLRAYLKYVKEKELLSHD